jgi:hypothetical protein
MSDGNDDLNWDRIARLITGDERRAARIAKGLPVVAAAVEAELRAVREREKDAAGRLALHLTTQGVNRVKS